MTIAKTLALTAALTLTTLATAVAGEGSPDLATPSPWNQNDPGGSNYGNGYPFNEPYPSTNAPYATTPRGAYRSTVRPPYEEENTGAVTRQKRYEEENGVND